MPTFAAGALRPTNSCAASAIASAARHVHAHSLPSVVQSIIFLYLYFIIGFFVIFFLWCLAGFGITGNRAFVETCDMMKLHVAGDRNPTVLEELHCDDLAGGRGQINDAVVSGNNAVADLNEQLASADSSIGVFNSDHEPLVPVCLPFDFDNVTMEYTIANGTADCTLLRNDTIEAAYSPRVCDADLPPDPSPLTNAEFRV